MNILKYKKIFFSISGALVIASLLALILFGLRLGIDFTGGTLLEIEYDGARPELSVVESLVNPLALGSVRVQEAGEKAIILRSRALTENEHQAILSALSSAGAVFQEKRYTSVGPILGSELKNKAITAILLTSLCIVFFIAYAFRKVSHPVKSWKYGIVAIVALIHDITIPAGLFAVLGHLYGVEVDALFVTALLAILGLSVNDTIVVFDRIRENLTMSVSKKFYEVVDISLNETIARSINTSVTTLLALLALIVWGPASTKFFALALAVGLVVGTYSSIFIASPLLVVLEGWQKKGK